jgi:hypothetical protein
MGDDLNALHHSGNSHPSQDETCGYDLEPSKLGRFLFLSFHANTIIIEESPTIAGVTVRRGNCWTSARETHARELVRSTR